MTDFVKQLRAKGWTAQALAGLPPADLADRRRPHQKGLGRPGRAAGKKGERIMNEVKIYMAIEQYEYEPVNILGCYSTLEKAQKKLDKAKEKADKREIAENRLMFRVKVFTLDADMPRDNLYAKQPYFTIPEASWGDKWEAGETIDVELADNGVDIVDASNMSNNCMNLLDGSPDGLVRTQVAVRNAIFAAFNLGRRLNG